MSEGIMCTRCYLKIDERDWIKNDVVPWNPTDPEDGGWRDCPACDTLADKLPVEIDCRTCGGDGFVQWAAAKDKDDSIKKIGDKIGIIYNISQWRIKDTK